MNKKLFECKKTLKCKRCGNCCIIRQSEIVKLTDEEDYKIRKKLYENTGIIYLYPLKHYTISLTKEEKDTLETEAQKLKIKIKILPKKITINTNKTLENAKHFRGAKNSNKFFSTKAEIIDYFLDHDICPFLKNKNFCLIYNSRPQVCRIFPHIMKQDRINQLILVEKDSNFEHILKMLKNSKNFWHAEKHSFSSKAKQLTKT